MLLLHLYFSIECGRCSGSRSPAVLSYSMSFLMSSRTQGIDVHPSSRLCAIRTGTHRWFAPVLLNFMLLLSISCTSVSSSVRLASAAAAFFSFDLCFLRSSLCHVFHFLLWRRLFLCQRFLGIFFRARAFQY